MQKSFSLVETLIATLLLSVTIASLIKLKDNNLYILSNVNDKDQINGYISIHTVSNDQDDKKINFKEYISLNNDELRKEIKEVKIEYKNELEDKFELDLKDDIKLKFNIKKETYLSEKLGTKTFFRVELN